MENKRILVSGGGGFIGTNLVNEWFVENRENINRSAEF